MVIIPIIILLCFESKTEAMTKTYVPPGWINKQPLSVAEFGDQGSYIATTNFEKSFVGLQIFDLYQFIRKVMEKT